MYIRLLPSWSFHLTNLIASADPISQSVLASKANVTVLDVLTKHTPPRYACHSLFITAHANIISPITVCMRHRYRYLRMHHHWQGLRLQLGPLFLKKNLYCNSCIFVACCSCTLITIVSLENRIALESSTITRTHEITYIIHQARCPPSTMILLDVSIFCNIKLPKQLTRFRCKT